MMEEINDTTVITTAIELRKTLETINLGINKLSTKFQDLLILKSIDSAYDYELKKHYERFLEFIKDKTFNIKIYSYIIDDDVLLYLIRLSKMFFVVTNSLFKYYDELFKIPSKQFTRVMSNSLQESNKVWISIEESLNEEFNIITNKISDTYSIRFYNEQNEKLTMNKELEEKLKECIDENSKLKDQLQNIKEVTVIEPAVIEEKKGKGKGKGPPPQGLPPPVRASIKPDEPPKSAKLQFEFRANHEQELNTFIESIKVDDKLSIFDHVKQFIQDINPLSNDDFTYIMDYIIKLLEKFTENQIIKNNSIENINNYIFINLSHILLKLGNKKLLEPFTIIFKKKSKDEKKLYYDNITSSLRSITAESKKKIQMDASSIISSLHNIIMSTVKDIVEVEVEKPKDTQEIFTINVNDLAKSIQTNRIELYDKLLITSDTPITDDDKINFINNLFNIKEEDISNVTSLILKLCTYIESIFTSIIPDISINISDNNITFVLSNKQAKEIHIVDANLKFNTTNYEAIKNCKIYGKFHTNHLHILHISTNTKSKIYENLKFIRKNIVKEIISVYYDLIIKKSTAYLKFNIYNTSPCIKIESLPFETLYKDYESNMDLELLNNLLIYKLDLPLEELAEYIKPIFIDYIKTYLLTFDKYKYLFDYYNNVRTEFKNIKDIKINDIICIKNELFLDYKYKIVKNNNTTIKEEQYFVKENADLIRLNKFINEFKMILATILIYFDYYTPKSQMFVPNIIPKTGSVSDNITDEQFDKIRVFLSYIDDQYKVKEKPIEEKPVEEMPIEEMPIEEKPIEEKPIEEKPVVSLALTDISLMSVKEIKGDEIRDMTIIKFLYAICYSDIKKPESNKYINNKLYTDAKKYSTLREQSYARPQVHESALNKIADSINLNIPMNLTIALNEYDLTPKRKEYINKIFNSYEVESKALTSTSALDSPVESASTSALELSKSEYNYIDEYIYEYKNFLQTQTEINSKLDGLNSFVKLPIISFVSSISSTIKNKYLKYKYKYLYLLKKQQLI
jgi:hypothetical protein